MIPCLDIDRRFLLSTPSKASFDDSTAGDLRAARGSQGVFTPVISSRQNLPRSGFTLIELTVVLTLFALLAGVAIVQLRGPYRRAQLALLVQRIEQLDQLVRIRARQNQQAGRITVNLKQAKLSGFSSLDATKPLAQVSFRGHGRVDRVVTSKGTTSSNQKSITIGRRGQSGSYALRLAGNNREQIWILFTARTGQMTQLESEREVRRLLLPETSGTDSH